MLPLYLSLEGLYSYQKKQEVDFTQLTEGGLFGIFGTVGSGKSSILEAISFALYGETERLNKQEKRAYNMLNLKSDTAIIDFQFLNFEGRKFRFVAQWKRKKKFEETSTIERYAYEWQDDRWIPLASADGALVTNLSYPNFRRTIIIPQGQFKEFLELKGKDRSDMMKEIFFLDQYDLGPRVSFLQADNNKKIEHIKGALTGFEEVSQEILSEREHSLFEARTLLSSVKAEFEKVDQTLRILQVEKENQSALDAKELELKNLALQLPQIQHYEKELSQFETVSNKFKNSILNLHNITANKEQLLHKIEKLKESKNLLSDKIAVTERQLSEIQTDYLALETSKKSIEDFRLLLANTELDKNKSELQVRIGKGSPIVEQTKKREKELQDQLLNQEIQLDKSKNSKIQTHELMLVENWFQKQDQLLNQLSDIEIKRQNQEKEIQSYHAQLEQHNLNAEEWQITLQERISQVLTKSSALKERENTALVQQELSQYVLKLQDGTPCPLCGSLDHPSPMHESDDITQINLLSTERNKLDQEEQMLRDLYTKASNIVALIIDKKKGLEELENKRKEYQDLLLLHEQLFVWQNFEKENRDAFEQRKNEAQLLENKIVQEETHIKNTRLALQETTENLAKYSKSLDDLKHQISIIDAKILQNLNQIKVPSSEKYFGSSKDNLQTELTALMTKITTVEQQFNSWNESLIKDKNHFAAIVGQYSEAHEQYITLSSQLQQLQGTINSLLKEFQFADITVVKSILDKNLDVPKLREKIQQFHIQYNTLITRIEELKEITKQSTFTPDILAETEEIHRLKKEELELQLSLTGILEKDLARLTIELDKKKHLLEGYEKLNSRKDNLKLLDNMFKGNGFINYVSSIHLARLCEIANVRFQRLTKNQLSLCLNENNEFEVIDYLHNGYQRSVKTLSGGQSFQASLCLALALAENIQSLNKADRNFFFIDEGFGTQDTESINTVFDTLQYLHHENRVVGIISHVEELKERMPRSITVNKDLEKGSQIQHN